MDSIKVAHFAKTYQMLKENIKQYNTSQSTICDDLFDWKLTFISQFPKTNTIEIDHFNIWTIDID